MRIIKPILVALLFTTLSSCSMFKGSTDTNEASTSVAAAPSTASNTLSPWYEDSLPLCDMNGSQLKNFLHTPSNDLWQRLRAGFQFPVASNSRVQQQLNWYGKHPRYISSMSERSAKYLHHVVEELEKRNMPMEIALIPIVESAYNPFASGPANATGLWQFLPGTARVLGIKRNNWYDGRRDIVTSTDAALDYLQNLNNQFNGDWLLTISAYNRGSKTIEDMIKKNRKNGKPTDYWSLEFPKEAGTYIPRLLAIRAVLEDPDRYGVNLYPIPNSPYFTEVTVHGPINLSQAARFANVSMDELYGLNAGCLRGTTDPNGPHKLVIPSDKAELFTERLASMPIEKPNIGRHYTVLQGDTLSSIAKRNLTTVEELRTINNLKEGDVSKGKVILIPAVEGASQISQETPSGTSKSGEQKQQYKVASGDSLWIIAKRFKVSTQSLIKWNNLGSNHTLRPGQILTISSSN